MTLGLLAGAVVFIGSCGGGDDQPAAEFTISMLDNSFDQDVYEVPIGAVVEFINDGRNPHNAFAVDGSWSTQDATGDSLMLADERAVLTFDDPGTYEFFCTIHATQQDDGSYEGMVATLVVGESNDTTSQADTATDSRRRMDRRHQGGPLRLPHDPIRRRRSRSRRSGACRARCVSRSSERHDPLHHSQGY